ncbi:MAG: hypothetical protein AAFO94_17115, partial [Bacteroidota bacterium]
NQLTSFWIAYHEGGENSPVLDRFRRTQFESNIMGFYGVTASGFLDVGVQLRYSRSRIDNAATSSMFRVFNNDQLGEADPFYDPANVFDQSFGGLTYLGLRFRMKPIASQPGLLINGGYLRSTIKDPLDQLQLAADRDIADLGVTYYKRITSSIYYFAGANIQAFLPSSVRDEYLFNSNFSFFAVHRTTDGKLTFYPGVSYSINYKPSQFDDATLIKVADFLFFLASVQYAPIPQFNLFVTGGLPLNLKVTHPNQKIVRASYSTLALGFRGNF